MILLEHAYLHQNNHNNIMDKLCGANEAQHSLHLNERLVMCVRHRAKFPTNIQVC